MTEANKNHTKSAKDDKSFWKLLLVSIGFFLTIDLMRSWIREPFATGLTVLLIGLAFYWVPPKPNTTFGEWFIRVVKWAILFLLARAAYEIIRKRFVI